MSHAGGATNCQTAPQLGTAPARVVPHQRASKPSLRHQQAPNGPLGQPPGVGGPDGSVETKKNGFVINRKGRSNSRSKSVTTAPGSPHQAELTTALEQSRTPPGHRRTPAELTGSRRTEGNRRTASGQGVRQLAGLTYSGSLKPLTTGLLSQRLPKEPSDSIRSRRALSLDQIPTPLTERRPRGGWKGSNRVGFLLEPKKRKVQSPRTETASPLRFCRQ